MEPAWCGRPQQQHHAGARPPFGAARARCAGCPPPRGRRRCRGRAPPHAPAAGSAARAPGRRRCSRRSGGAPQRGRGSARRAPAGGTRAAARLRGREEGDALPGWHGGGGSPQRATHAGLPAFHKLQCALPRPNSNPPAAEVVWAAWRAAAPPQGCRHPPPQMESTSLSCWFSLGASLEERKASRGRWPGGAAPLLRARPARPSSQAPRCGASRFTASMMRSTASTSRVSCGDDGLGGLRLSGRARCRWGEGRQTSTADAVGAALLANRSCCCRSQRLLDMRSKGGGGGATRTEACRKRVPPSL